MINLPMEENPVVVGARRFLAACRTWGLWAGCLALLGGSLDRSVGATTESPQLLWRRPAGIPGARTGAGPSFPGGFSGAGRYVLFSSAAPDLVPTDPNGAGWDVFRRDWLAGRTELVSFESGGRLDGRDPSSSHDGETVSFVTRFPVTPVAPGIIDTNQASDVLVRRMNGGDMELISVRSDGKARVNGASWGSEIA